MVTILGFGGHTASVARLQPCRGRTNAATRDTEVAGWAVIHHHFTESGGGHGCLWAAVS